MTGIMLTAPGGSRFWHACPTAKKGYQEMASASFVYGAAWEHPETTVVFGRLDGNEFVPIEQIWPKGA